MVLLLLIALFLSPQGINSSHSSKISERTVITRNFGYYMQAYIELVLVIKKLLKCILLEVV